MGNYITGAQPDIFQGRGGFMKLGHFDKKYVFHWEEINFDHIGNSVYTAKAIMENSRHCIN